MTSTALWCRCNIPYWPGLLFVTSMHPGVTHTVMLGWVSFLSPLLVYGSIQTECDGLYNHDISRWSQNGYEYVIGNCWKQSIR